MGKLAACLLTIWLALALHTAAAANMEAAPVPLQELIDKAKAGETIVLSDSRYEGPIVIDKSLRLEVKPGEEAVLVNTADAPAIQIRADAISLIGLTIVDEAIKKKPSVLIEADHILLDALHIRTGSFGIQMREADDGEVRNTTIEWAGVRREGPIRLSDKGNGIDLYQSDRVHMHGNSISGMHDGIYVENSDASLIENNRFELLRYGVHCMYTKETIISNNEGLRNVTGAMIMAVQGVEVSGNTFTKQSENVNSQGILLFDAHSSSIRGNVVEGNRVGLYVEQSTKNRIEDNAITNNFIGIQLLDSSGNGLTGNQFIGNVASAEALNSSVNSLKGNYWDSFQGIDTDGDGYSNTSYAVNPFFQSLVKARPGFQLFFQSPGMVFLEELYQSERELWATDASPLMAPLLHRESDVQAKASPDTAVWGVMLLVAAFILIYNAGVRRR